MVNIILSPYFTKNTKLVANFCRKCYQEEKEDDVVITAVNIRFLRIYDQKQYQIFTNNFFFIPHIKFEPRLKEKEDYWMKCKQSTKSSNDNEQFLRYRYMMRVKQGIIKKYLKLRLNRKNSYRTFNSIQESFKIREQVLDKDLGKLMFEHNQEKFNTEKYSVPEIKEENNEKELIKQYIKGEQYLDNIDDKTLIKLPMKNYEEQESKNFKEQLQNYIKVEKMDDIEEKPKWIPPISPHNLIEERYYNDPWALIVVTIFLNKTSCVLALPYMEKFFEEFKGPYDVLKVEVCSLEPYFTKIGLVRTRANQVWRMSYDFVHKDWKNVSELFGVGKYAEDAYRMFHLGDFNVEPTDRYLKIYKAWYKMKQRNEKLGIFQSNSQVYLEDYFISPKDEDRTEDVEDCSCP